MEKYWGARWKWSQIRWVAALFLHLDSRNHQLMSTAPQQTRKNTSFDETVRAFSRQWTEKPVVFPGRPARRMQYLGGKLTDSIRELQCLAITAYPEESNAIRDHLVVRGFLEGIPNSRVSLDLRSSLVDAELTLEKVLEQALQFEVDTRNGEEEREPTVTFF